MKHYLLLLLLVGCLVIHQGCVMLAGASLVALTGSLYYTVSDQEEKADTLEVISDDLMEIATIIEDDVEKEITITKD